MTRADIEAVIAKIPDLTENGVGIFLGGKGRGLTPEQKEAELREGQRALLESVEGCTRVCEWLAGVEATANAERGVSSYTLKDFAEREIGYITIGAIIAAAVHCGFPYRLDGGANPLIGITRASLKAKGFPT